MYRPVVNKPQAPDPLPSGTRRPSAVGRVGKRAAVGLLVTTVRVPSVAASPGGNQPGRAVSSRIAPAVGHETPDWTPPGRADWRCLPPRPREPEPQRDAYGCAAYADHVPHRRSLRRMRSVVAADRICKGLEL